MYEQEYSIYKKIRPHLDHNEELQWSGQPSLKWGDFSGFQLFFMWNNLSWIRTYFYSYRFLKRVAILAVFIWLEVQALRIYKLGGSVYLPIIGLLIILVILYVLFGRFLYEKIRRENTYYGVTNKRIIIVSEIFD